MKLLIILAFIIHYWHTFWQCCNPYMIKSHPLVLIEAFNKVMEHAQKDLHYKTK